MWDRLPNQRIGVRSYMRSTYQRTGTGSKHHPDDPGYEFTDASHFLFYNEDEHDNVTLDVKGMGVLYFFRANHWHGSPWNFQIDGKSNVVQETGTSDPVNAKRTLKTPKFIPEEPFPKPLNWTWATTKGADLIGTPMPFRESLRISYGQTFYGTGYYIYHLFADEENLSRPLRSWDISQIPDQDVLDLLNSAGADIAPRDIPRKAGKVALNKERLLLAEIHGPSVIRALKMTLPMDKAIDLERVRLRVTWDDAAHPSIDAPLCLFYGAGTFYNRDEKEYLVKGLPINVRFDYEKKQVELACYYPMPFFKSSRFELTGIDPNDAEIRYEIRHEPFQGDPNLSGYFHATYTDFPEPELAKEMVFLDTQGIEGHDTWSGSFVGTSFIFSHNAVLFCLEGDPKFYFDDSRTPQAHGTGTEEWAGGGGFWGGKTMTLPLYGHPVGAPRKAAAKNKKDLIQSGYRFLWADVMPFGRRARITFEQGDMFTREHYEAVAYWYGLPAPSLVKTDSLDVGDPAGEKAHRYHSPSASDVETITSRWDGAGMDVFPATFHGVNIAEKYPRYKDRIGTKIYPEETEQGRFTRGTSEFTVKLDPNNVGAMLRRVLDYSFPNQTAKVFVADASSGTAADTAQWEEAGVWYLAGATTHLYSWPRGKYGELAKRVYDVQESTRRFRDDEFLIPARLTKGRSAIRVRIAFVRNDQTLYSGYPYPKESAWSELRYDVFSFIVPCFDKP
ncbi:MAG: DUF2961 domain-containing protein [Pirellulaceae bacterium]|nr:DUF2961 domain-containing protein [Pirellulaceae bacterium]